MRGLIASLVIFSACTANIKDERVNASGTANGAITGTDTADATAGNGPKPAAPAGDPNAALADYLPAAYTPELEPYVQRLCTGSCHTGAPAQGSPILNSATALKSAVGAAAAIDAGKMPLNAANLSAADKKYLAQLSISLKNWAKNDGFALELSEYKITFEPGINNLSKALCISCHQGDKPSAGVRLETLDQWKTAMPRILRAVETGSMPPKIDGVQGPRLLKFLTEWQDNGFP